MRLRRDPCESGAAGIDLEVDATLSGPIDGPLVVGAAPYLDALKLETEAGGEPPSLGDTRHWQTCARRCRFHYGIHLAEAAASLQDIDVEDRTPDSRSGRSNRALLRQATGGTRHARIPRTSSLEHQWLYLNPLDSLGTVRKLV